MQYKIEQTKIEIKLIGAGGTEGGYRNWLLAEEKRLAASYEKVREAISQLEIRAPVSGRVMEVNDLLEKGSHIRKKGWLLTLGNEKSREIRAYAREDVYRDLRETKIQKGEVIFKDLETSVAKGVFREMLDFPVMVFPNESLFDFAGGPIMASMDMSQAVKSRQAYYPLIFDVQNTPGYLRHGMACNVRLDQGERRSVMARLARASVRILAEEGFI